MESPLQGRRGGAGRSSQRSTDLAIFANLVLIPSAEVTACLIKLFYDTLKPLQNFEKSYLFGMLTKFDETGNIETARKLSTQ